MTFVGVVAGSSSYLAGYLDSAYPWTFVELAQELVMLASDVGDVETLAGWTVEPSLSELDPAYHSGSSSAEPAPELVVVGLEFGLAG